MTALYWAAPIDQGATWAYLTRLEAGVLKVS